MVFSNWETLLMMHRDAILPDLRQTIASHSEAVGSTFVKHSAFIRMYSPYVNHFETASSELDRLLLKRKKFKQFCLTAQTDPRHTQMNLQFYLIMPVQRIPRYKLLLEDLLKHTPEMHPDFQALVKALDEIRRRASEINERKRAQENNEKIVAIQNRIRGTFKTPLVQPHRRLLKECVLRLERMVKLTLKNKSTMLKETRVERHFVFFLFNDILIQCKPIANSSESSGTSYELQRTLTLTTHNAPASMVMYPWILSDQQLLRLVDADLVLYLSCPSASSEELAQWCHAINHRTTSFP